MAKYDPQYEREKDWLVHKYVQDTGDVLRFQAHEIRKTATGVHARVQLTWNGIAMGDDTFNVGRDQDRTRIFNAAMKRLDQREQKPSMKREDLDHAFDLFCVGLWDEQVSQLKGKPMKGDASLRVSQLVRGLVVEGGGTAIYAPPGRGKTYTLLILAACIDSGIPVNGFFEVLRQEKVLFINLERSERSMKGRLGAVNKSLGLDEDRELLFINARGRSLRDLFQPAQDTMRENGCSVVVVDSLSRMGSGSMVDDEDANRSMDMLNALAPTWICSAHTSRADESHIFGSQMYDAAIDVGVQLRSEQRNGTTGIALQVTKENDLGVKPLHLGAYRFGAGGLEEIRRAYRGEFPEAEASDRKPDLMQDIIQLLLKVGEMSATDIAEELGQRRDSVARVLSKGEGVWFTRRKEGRNVLYAMRKLVNLKREDSVGS